MEREERAGGGDTAVQEGWEKEEQREGLGDRYRSLHGQKVWKDKAEKGGCEGRGDGRGRWGVEAGHGDGAAGGGTQRRL